MIEFSHVYKAYRDSKPALSDINLQIEKGDFVFLTGPSGSGKTTLFRLLSAFDKPTSGLLRVGNFEISRLNFRDTPFLRRQIGVVFQDFKLLKDRTVFENVSLPLIVLGERPQAISKRVDHILDLVGLRFKKDEFPEHMSGGEQQRVAIARALIHKPGILVADEPTGNLDPDLSVEVMQLFQNVNSEGTTVFIATHDHQMVQKSGRRRINLRAGQIEGDSFHESNNITAKL